MLSLLLVLGVLTGGSALDSTPSDLQTRNALTFEAAIRPILERSCLECHGKQKRLHARFDVRTLQSIRLPSENGLQIVPGNPEKSLLWTEMLKDNMMPPQGGRYLSAAEKQLIHDWIKAGCP